MSKSEVRILTLQPFYGGSHKQFIDGWIKRSRHDWTLLSLPARHWKWRMRHAAVAFAEQIDQLWKRGQRWDLILCSDMLNLAELRGLVRTDAAKLPVIIYFHENQFEYPDRNNQPRDFHFAFTNFTSACAADEVWFNSEFNQLSMRENLRVLAKRWPDFQPSQAIESISAKSYVQYPGIDTVEPEIQSPRQTHLIWAARWEHDKNPEDLLCILDGLHDSGMEFLVSVIGERFSEWPDSFDEIKQRHADRIVHWGYQNDRDKYLMALQEANIFLSTAHHEFFGIAAVEAIAAGCIPILPNRLSYPELLQVFRLPERAFLLYETVNQAVESIKRIDSGNFDENMTMELSKEFRRDFCWKNRAAQLDDAVSELLDRTATT